MTFRWTLEACGLLEPRRSALEDDFEEEEEKEEEDAAMEPLDDDIHEKVLIPTDLIVSLHVF